MAPITIQFLFLFTMTVAIWGSHEFVRSNFNFGAKLFVIGNFFNIFLGIYLGNIFLSLAQFGLVYFTMPLFNMKKEKNFFYTLFIFTITLCLLFWGKVDPSHFTFNPSDVIDLTATITAWIGAYMMAKQRYTAMAIAWIVADIGFLWIAYEQSVWGLGIMATVFIINGFRRLLQ